MSQSVLWSFKKGPLVAVETERFVKSGLIRFIGMSKVGVQKSLRQISRRFEALIETARASGCSQKRSTSNPYTWSIMDVMPRVPMCFDSGLLS
jgi:hypothetical protein